MKIYNDLSSDFKTGMILYKIYLNNNTIVNISINFHYKDLASLTQIVVFQITQK